MEPSLSTFVVAQPTIFSQCPLPPLAFAFSHGARPRQLPQPSLLPFVLEKSEARYIHQQTAGRRRRRQFNGPRRKSLFSFEYDDEDSASFEDYEESEDDVELMGKSNNLSKLESLEDLLMDLENDLESLLDDDDDDVELDEDDFDDDSDVEALLSLLGEADDEDYDEEEDEDYDDNEDEDYDEEEDEDYDEDDEDDSTENKPISLATNLEQALLQGVVPVSAGVGSDALPGDWGFDPLHFAEKDFILQTQYILLQSLPGSVKEDPPASRPTALILRDYREAEIRHGRLAMLAAIFWPLQEMLDRLILDVDQFGPLIYGPVTLPYFPLLMTLIMMLLGYLDIYAKAIQEKDDIGDAFLPGDCFWDPLFILEGAPASMKRNMQERELFNGRVAMLAFAAYTFEEATTHLPLISVKGNELLFLPAYQVPYIQEYLDQQFSFYS